MDPSSRRLLARIALYSFGYSLKYLAAGFLTGAVLPSVGVLTMGYVSVWGPDIPFIPVLSLFLPIDEQGSAKIDGADIMRAFALVSLIVAALIELVNAVRKLLGLPAANRLAGGGVRSGLRSLVATLIVITIVFASSALAFAIGNAEQGATTFAILGMVAVFYVIAIGSTAAHRVTDVVAEAFLGLAKRVPELATQ